ncbi:MAG TPA: HlyD family efflux transporter periplasmic adaptor subunit [Thermoanaerobaculia bacterium]|nr:HlyD family efflux transporter periplasmic adaptor subunit [Thermoanaerobaculia bacterium]
MSVIVSREDGEGSPWRRGSLAALGMTLILCACHRDAIPTYTAEPAQFARRVTADGVLKAVKATPLSAPMNIQQTLRIASIADDGAFVKKDQVVVTFDPTDFQKDLLGGNEDRETAENKISKTVTLADATRTNLKRDARQADAELIAAKHFKYDDAEIFSRYQRIESQIDQTLAGDKKEHAENVLGVRDKLSRADRDLLTIEEKKAGLKIRNAEQGLHSLEMRAPYDGILVLQRDWRGDVPRVGNSVWPGETLGEIPDLRAMKAEVFVLEADAAGLAVGEKAIVRLESNPLVAYSGKVSQVDKLARPRFRGVPVQYFGLTVTLDETDPAVMKPGARVRATLDVEDRANVFSIPRQALFEKEGKKLVYRKHGSGFEAVPVDIATSTPGRVVVTKGLVKGDELALRDPSVATRSDE